MIEDAITMPHKLTLTGRKNLTLTGVTEVVRFDDEEVVLNTAQGTLTIHGSQLQLKNLSLEGGQVAVDGTVEALIYQEPKPMRRGLGRLLP